MGTHINPREVRKQRGWASAGSQGSSSRGFSLHLFSPHPPLSAMAAASGPAQKCWPTAYVTAPGSGEGHGLGWTASLLR